MLNRFNILLILLIGIIQLVPAVAVDRIQQNADMLREIGVVEKLGDYIPLDLTFVNEKGEEVTLQSYFEKGKPVLLNLIYFECPSICSLILNGVADGLKDLRWTPGREFQVITVSIDHEEDHILAAQQKEAYIEALGRPEVADGWHFLTGEEDQIRALADAVGFNFKWSEEAQEYLHGSAIMFLSPEGRISRYLGGVMYSELNIRNALFDAADGRVGSAMERIMLYCFTFDPDSGSYAPVAVRIMKVGGAAILLVLGLFIGIFLFKERRSTPKELRFED